MSRCGKGHNYKEVKETLESIVKFRVIWCDFPVYQIISFYLSSRYVYFSLLSPSYYYYCAFLSPDALVIFSTHVFFLPRFSFIPIFCLSFSVRLVNFYFFILQSISSIPLPPLFLLFHPTSLITFWLLFPLSSASHSSSSSSYSYPIYRQFLMTPPHISFYFGTPPSPLPCRPSLSLSFSLSRPFAWNIGRNVSTGTTKARHIFGAVRWASLAVTPYII